MCSLQPAIWIIRIMVCLPCEVELHPPLSALHFFPLLPSYCITKTDNKGFLTNTFFWGSWPCISCHLSLPKFHRVTHLRRLSNTVQHAHVSSKPKHKTWSGFSPRGQVQELKRGNTTCPMLSVWTWLHMTGRCSGPTDFTRKLP